MSNEPKWTAKIDQDSHGKLSYIVRKGEGCDGTFLAESKYFAEMIAEKLNHLDSEVERLNGKMEAWKNQYITIEGLYHESQSDLERCKAERLGAEEVGDLILFYTNNYDDVADCIINNEILGHAMELIITIPDLITAFRASQLNADQTQEGKG